MATRQAAEKYLEGICAETIDEAQACAEEAQLLLDAATLPDEVLPIGGLQDLATRASAAAAVQDSNLAVIDRRLVASVGSGDPAGYPSGVGFQLYALDAVANELFDRVNFDHLKGAYAKAVSSGSGATVFATQEWRAEAMRVDRLVAREWRTLAHVVSDDGGDLESVAALLSLAEASRETVLRFALATLLAAKDGSWGRWFGKSSGDIAKAAQREFPYVGLEQVDNTLRHASAHRSFDVAGDVVTLTLSGGDNAQYEFGTFLDACLHQLEISSAYHFALIDHVSASGVDWPTSGVQSRQDREDALTFALGVSGLTVAAVAWKDGEVTITADGSADRQWGPLAAAIATLLPTETARVLVRCRSLELIREVRIELGPVRASVNKGEGCSEDEEMFLVLGALQAITVDEVNQLPAPWWGGVLSHFANWRGSDTVRTQVERLLTLRPLVEATSDPELGATYRGLLRAARDGQLAEPVSRDSAFSRANSAISGGVI